MSVPANLLKNIECEYKFALNEAYGATFVQEFCGAFNEWLKEHYAQLPDDFKSSHPIENYLADAAKVEVEELENGYFDTEDDLIFAKFKAGLRLRRSSLVSGVEQTIKYKSEDGGVGAAHTHVEHNLHVDQDLSKPYLTLFAPGVLPRELVALTTEHELVNKYQTNFTRTKLTFEVPAFVTFELAFDHGSIIAGTCTSPICEIECELKAISPEYLEANYGSRIYDLDDVRLEFSALLSKLLLKVAGNSQTKPGGVVGLEPFSKLKRAVLLASFHKDNPERPVDATVDVPAVLDIKAGTRIDFSSYLNAMYEYEHLSSPSVEQFARTYQYLITGFNNALGLALLLGTRQHFEDLHELLKGSLLFAEKHLRFDDARAEAECLAKAPELAELLSRERLSRYLEDNGKQVLLPFAEQLSAAFKSFVDPISAKSVRALCCSFGDNTFAIKFSQFMERIVYLFARKAALASAPQDDAFKALVEATKCHAKEL